MSVGPQSKNLDLTLYPKPLLTFLRVIRVMLRPTPFMSSVLQTSDNTVATEVSRKNDIEVHYRDSWKKIQY